MPRFSALWVLLGLLALAPGGHAARVRIEGDRLTVTADRTPLRELLEEFARAGIHVRFDPSIDVRITGSCRSAPMDEALDALLEPYAYVLVWEIVPGPLADLPKLAEIQVFQPGHKEQARPLPTDGNFRVARGPLPTDPEFVADEVLLTVRSGTDVEDFQRLLAQIGATVVDGLEGLGVYRIRLPRDSNVLDLVRQLERNPMVEGAEPNYTARLPESPAAPSAPSRAPGPLTVARDAAPVAVLDSGLLAGQGLDRVVVGQLDAVQPGRALDDKAGHGTQMALVAAGGVQPWGVADSEEAVPIVAVRAFDDEGVTSNYALFRALNYALDQGARVINLSWGSETRSAFMQQAVAYAQARGAVVVAAAGNEPSGRAYYPAAYDGVVAVSALTESGDAWERSNYGSFVDVAAPGQATFPIGHDGPPGSYAGTSIASAYVARELALYFTRHPRASASDALRALRESVTDTGDKGRDARYGDGALDGAALRKLRGL